MVKSNCVPFNCKADKQAIIFATDRLVSVFSKQYAPFVLGRNIGLGKLNYLYPLKRQFIQFAMRSVKLFGLK